MHTVDGQKNSPHTRRDEFKRMGWLSTASMGHKEPPQRRCASLLAHDQSKLQGHKPEIVRGFAKSNLFRAPPKEERLVSSLLPVRDPRTT